MQWTWQILRPKAGLIGKVFRVLVCMGNSAVWGSRCCFLLGLGALVGKKQAFFTWDTKQGQMCVSDLLTSPGPQPGAGRMDTWSSHTGTSGWMPSLFRIESLQGALGVSAFGIWPMERVLCLGSPATIKSQIPQPGGFRHCWPSPNKGMVCP